MLKKMIGYTAIIYQFQEPSKTATFIDKR